MNQKLSHHIYRSSLIGLLSTSVLLTMTVGGATAATVSSAERVAAVTPSDKQLTTKKVVRTISYVDPLTGKEHTVHQVASYQFDRAGQLIRTVNPVWQPFFTPIFPGYVPTNGVEIAPKVTTPDTPDKEEKFTYIPLIDKNDQSYMARIHFSALDGTDLRTYDTGVLGENDNPLLSFTLPTPPDGWEYVDQDQLPKSIAVTPGTTNAFTFLVREKTPHQESKPETHQENKQLCRKIILHLPSGDQTIVQHATATRHVTVKDGKTSYGEWQITPFAELPLSPLAGYQLSTTKVAALQLTPDQLEEALPPIEVQYHKITNDQGTSTTTTSEATTMTDPLPMTDAGSQTTALVTSEKGTATVSGKDADTQTVVDSKDTATQTNSPASSEEATQTSTPSTSASGSQTEAVTGKDEGTQTATSDQDEENQTNLITTKNDGNQTEAVTGKDEGAQTATSDQDEENQTNLITTKNDGSQTEQPTVNNEGSQTPARPTVETGVGDDTTTGNDQGAQTDNTAMADSGTGDDQVAGVSQATTQTRQPTMTDTGSGAGTIDQQDQGTQTVTPNTVDLAVGDDEIKTIDHASQTNSTPTTDTGTGSGVATVVDQATQTAPTTTGSTVNQAAFDPATPTGTPGQHNGVTAPSSENQQVPVPESSVVEESQNEGSTTSKKALREPGPTLADGKTAASDLDPAAFHAELDQLQQPLRQLATHPGRPVVAAALPQTGNRPTTARITVMGLLLGLMTAGAAMFIPRKRP